MKVDIGEFKLLEAAKEQPLVAMGIILAVLSAYYVAGIVYNIWFHPLSKFPGPWFRSAFYFVNYLEEVQGVQAWRAKALHDKYGPVVRLGPDSLSFNSERAWKDVYGVTPGKPEKGKDPKFYTQNTNGLPSILVSNHADHARIRKLVVNSFSDSAVRNQEPIMTDYIKQMIDQLKVRADGPQAGIVDISAWYMFTTFDTISDLCFGEPLGALRLGEYHPRILTILNSAKNGSNVRMEKAYPMYARISNLYKTIFKIPQITEARKEHMKYTMAKAESRMNSDLERNDIMTPIMRNNSEKGMSRPEIAQTMIVLMTAGTETTASGTSGLTYHLLTNKDKYERLVKEVRSSFSSEDEINNHACIKLPYLNAVINEALRMHPPVPARFPRRTNPGGDIIDDHFVPGNTSIGVHQWAVSHSARNFARPDDFCPERWLDNAPAEFKNDALSASQPFSVGPRNCIGKGVSWLQMRGMVSRLLWNFDMELRDECKTWTTQGARVLWDLPPLKVKLTRRKQ